MKSLILARDIIGGILIWLVTCALASLLATGVSRAWDAIMHGLR